jgi:predicted amidophosphoribosyltransferase
LDESLKNPPPQAIAIFDDVITTGASFKAAQEILQKEFPKIPIIGIFIARNVILEL